MDFEEITEQFDPFAMEMTSDPYSGVTLQRSVVEQVTEGDDDPRFATFVIESGWSRSQRYWGPELFNDVAEQINNSQEPIVGYMGHIRPEDDPYLFPEIQLQWLGAKAVTAGDRAKLLVKAYVLPNTKGRDYLKRRLVKTVSWRGKISAEKFQKGIKVKQFVIESIDLARPRTAGMSARLVGGLTSEMEEGGTDLKPEEISALQENELRAHNLPLVESIEAKARQPLETKVSEMETEAEAEKPVTDLIPKFRSVLDLGDDVDDVTVLSRALTAIKDAGKSVRDTILASVLDKKFKDAGTRSLVQRLIVSEMEDVRDFKATGDDDKDIKTISEMVNNFIDRDESLKEQVSEMEDNPPALASTERPRGAKRELKAGLQTSRIRVRSAR